jgi:hypothetical protein
MKFLRSKRISVAVAASFTLLLFAAASAEGAIRYATPSGAGDPSTCLEVAPCAIVDALNASYTNDGDEVVLASGDYSVSTPLGISDRIDVHGTGAAAATRIVSTGFPFGIVVGNANAVLHNVTITHSVGNESAVRLVNGSVRNVVAISSSAHGCTARDGTFRDTLCLAKASGYTGIFVNEGGGAPSLLHLRNVTAISTGTGGHGIRIYSGAALAATIDAIGIIARGTSYDVSAATDGSLGSSATINLDHSNYSTTHIDSGVASITSPSTSGNQTASPVFVNTAADDYHQVVGSPTIDAGAVDGSSGTTDIDGDARVIGSAADIGFDEYSPPPLPGSPAAPVDTTAPETGFKKKPRKRTTSRKAKFTLNSSESGSTFRCKLDRGSYKPCAATFSKRVKPGKHVLYVQAVDASGNKDATPAVYRWRVVRG